MKMKSVKAFLSIVTAASLAVSAPAAVFAEDAAAQEAEAQDSDGEATAEDFTIAFDGGELSVTNQTTQTIKEAKLVEAAADDSEEADNSEETADASKEAKMDLVLTEEDGTEHTFQDVTVDKWKDAVLVNSYEFLYINYKDESGKDQEAAETADERTFDEPITMYVSANVHVRKEADKESESLKVAALGDEFKVIAAVPGWFKVENGDESHFSGLLEYPQYTRPQIWHDKAVPEVLLGGNHRLITDWRHEQALKRTEEKRPDMYKKYKGID